MKKLIYAVLAFSPVLALAAATAPDFTGINGIVTSLKGVANGLIPLFFALAIVYFFWGLIQFLMNAGKDEKAHNAGKTHMIYGVIAIAVMLSIYGIVGWLQSTLGVNGNNSTPVVLPTV